VITDRKTGKCRGFGFVTVKTTEEADQLIEKFNGYLFKDNALKIEKALPRTKGKGEDESQGAEQPEEISNSQVERPARRSGGSKSNQKNKRTSTNVRSSNDSESTQPDPRWAQELEKLKQLLAAQTTNS
jgi:RNA recognition motif-containing protein